MSHRQIARTKSAASAGAIAMPPGLRKGFRPTNFKLDDQLGAGTQQGAFQCAFAQLNVKDNDGDVTLPGAFQDGQQVRICQWGHNWQALPVGKGTIQEVDGWAICSGQFFLDTIAGKDTYTTVKALGDLQEWSYGYNILDAAQGQLDGEVVQFLKSLDTFEISPVLLGAGIGTHTTDIKGASTPQGSDANAPDIDIVNTKAALAQAVQFAAITARLNGVDI